MLDLIIKNGECYIDGTLKKKDIGILNNKIVEGDILKIHHQKGDKFLSIKTHSAEKK